MTATKTLDKPYAQTEFISIVALYEVQERAEVADIIKRAFPRTIIVPVDAHNAEMESKEHRKGGNHTMSWRGYCHTCMRWASGSDGVR